jgi:acetamidase/formamidase
MCPRWASSWIVARGKRPSICSVSRVSPIAKRPDRKRGISTAYVICSVAVDLRISNVIDVPNFVVSALLPEAVFDGN